MTTVSQTHDLWDEAFRRIPKDTKQWKRFCKIVADQEIPGFALSNGTTSSVRALDPGSISAKDMLPIVQNLQSIVEREDIKPVRHFCSKAIDLLSSINDAASALAGLNPYAAAGWGIVAFLVAGAKRHATVKDFCWQRIPILASIVYRYQTYHDVYLDNDALPTSNEHLRATMVELFTQILQFQIACVIAVKSRTERLKMFVSDSETTQLSRNLDTQEGMLKDLQAVVNRQTDKIRFHDLLQTTRCLQQSLDSRLGLLDAHVTSIKAQINSSERNAVLEWISKTEYERVHAKPTKTPIGVTGDWLLQDERYRSWAEAKGDAVLWLFGKMGSGKSCVTHAVIESLKDSTENASSELLAFFYCDSTDFEGKSDMSSVENILRILLKQLADSDGGEILDARLIELYRRQKPKGRLTADQCIYWMSQLASSMGLTIVIDGLDESSVDVQRKLIDHIKSLSSQTDLPVKLYVASRNRKAIRTGLKALGASTYDTIDIAFHNQDPLNAMIDAKIENALAGSLRWLYVDEDQNLDQSKDVAMILKETADGMFQWVSSALSWLHESEDFYMLSDRMQMLSHLEELEDLYKELYNSNLKTATKGRNEIAMKAIILFVLYGKMGYSNWTEPDVDEPSLGLFVPGSDHEAEIKVGGPDLHIRQACSYLQTGNCQRSYSVDDLCNFCPGILSVSEVTGSLSFPHASVREFLTENDDLPEFSHRDGNAYLAAFCMNVFIDFERGFQQIASNLEGNGFRNQNTIVLYASQHWYHHVSEFAPSTEEDSEICDGLGSRDQSLGPRLSFKTALSSFLLCGLAPKPFVKWHEWMQEYRSQLVYRCYGATEGLLTKPPSTIFARSALGLSIDYSEFDRRKLLDVRGLRLSYDQPVKFEGTTTEFAIGNYDLSLLKALMAHGCLRLDTGVVERIVDACCDLSDLPSDMADFVPLEALKEIAKRDPSILRCADDTRATWVSQVDPPIYLLVQGMHPGLVQHMLSIFLDCGLSPTFEDEYLYGTNRFQIHWNRTEHGIQRGLIWHIANYKYKDVLVAPEIEVHTNRLLLEHAESTEDLRKMQEQAVQVGNVELISAIMQRGADTIRESDCKLFDLNLRSLGYAANGASPWMEWFSFKLVRNFDKWEVYLRRYTDTISFLIRQLMDQNSESPSEAQEGSLAGHKSGSLLKVVALCCDVEIFRFWIQKTAYQQPCVQESEENHSNACSSEPSEAKDATGSTGKLDTDDDNSGSEKIGDASSSQNQSIDLNIVATYTGSNDDFADSGSASADASSEQELLEDSDGQDGSDPSVDDDGTSDTINHSDHIENDTLSSHEDALSCKGSGSDQDSGLSIRQGEADAASNASSGEDEDHTFTPDLLSVTQEAIAEIDSAIAKFRGKKGVNDLSDEECSATIEGLEWYRSLIETNLEYLRSVGRSAEDSSRELTL